MEPCIADLLGFDWISVDVVRHQGSQIKTQIGNHSIAELCDHGGAERCEAIPEYVFKTAIQAFGLNDRSLNCSGIEQAMNRIQSQRLRSYIPHGLHDRVGIPSFSLAASSKMLTDAASSWAVFTTLRSAIGAD